MKIALVVQHFRADVGGAENVAVMVAAGLVAHGHRLLVCAETGHGIPGVEFLQLALPTAPAAAKAWGAEIVFDWGLNVPADIHRLGGGTHREFLEYSLQAYPAWRRWWKRIGYAWQPKHRKALSRERSLLLEPGTRFIAVSEFVANQLRQATAPHKPDVHIILNGVDTQRFAPENRLRWRETVRQRLGLGHDDIAFLFAAHNLGLKNFRLMARVFASLSQRRPQLRLVVAGKHDPKIHAPWCVYAGDCKHMEELYAAMDGLVHPTWYDAFGSVVLEAMATGLPVLVSDRTGASEIVLHDVNGMVLPVAGDSP